VTLFPLDAVRNAASDQKWEPALQAVRDDLPEDILFGDIRAEDVRFAFDRSRARLNVLLQLIADIPGTGADISTGPGFLPAALRTIGREIVATELDPAMAVMVPEGVRVLPYRIGEPLPLPQESFDYLVFGEVLEHLKHPPVWAISQFVPLLRRGGRFLLTTPNIARRSNVEALVSGENFLEPFPEIVPDGADVTDFVEHVREYSVREVVDAMEGAGLEVRQVLMTDWGEAGYEPAPNPYSNGIIVVEAER